MTDKAERFRFGSVTVRSYGRSRLSSKHLRIAATPMGSSLLPAPCEIAERFRYHTDAPVCRRRFP